MIDWIYDEHMGNGRHDFCGSFYGFQEYSGRWQTFTYANLETLPPYSYQSTQCMCFREESLLYCGEYFSKERRKKTVIKLWPSKAPKAEANGAQGRLPVCLTLVSVVLHRRSGPTWRRCSVGRHVCCWQRLKPREWLMRPNRITENGCFHV